MYTPFDDNDSGKLATTEAPKEAMSKCGADNVDSHHSSMPWYARSKLVFWNDTTEKKNTRKRDFAEVGKSSQMTLRTDFFWPKKDTIFW
jgi:sulfate adenylyltransferase subunit 1 (EFTu-like GTPase family)